MRGKPQDTGPRRAVGYVRVSLEEQARSGLSLADQEQKIRAYCELRGLELAAVVRDAGVSATTKLHKRPGGGELLEALRAGGASDVVAIKLDRLFRNAADCQANVEAWDAGGKALHLVDFGGDAISTRTSHGRLFINLLSGFAQFERDLIAERTSSALAYRRANKRPFCRDPYGWRREGERLVAEIGEQKVRRMIGRARDRGMSLRAIAALLNARGIRPKRGAAWYASTVRSVLRSRVGKAA